MVTRQDVKKVRKLLNGFNKKITVCISDDTIKAIENMCTDYEMRYNM